MKGRKPVYPWERLFPLKGSVPLGRLLYLLLSAPVTRPIVVGEPLRPSSFIRIPKRADNGRERPLIVPWLG